MIRIEDTLEHFEKLAEQLKCEPTQESKEKLLTALRETFTQINSDIDELKKRLISPEITYGELVEKVEDICKNEPEYDGTNLLIHAGYESIHGNPGEEEYEYVINRLTAVIGTELQEYSGDTLWYFRTNELAVTDDQIDGDAVLKDLIAKVLILGEKYLREIESERSGQKSLNDLKEMVLNFSHDTKIDSDSVYEWLSKKLEEESDPDRMTLAILFNMIESVIEEIPQERIISFVENGEVPRETDDPRESVIELLRSFLISECIKS